MHSVPHKSIKPELLAQLGIHFVTSVSIISALRELNGTVPAEVVDTDVPNRLPKVTRGGKPFAPVLPGDEGYGGGEKVSRLHALCAPREELPAPLYGVAAGPQLVFVVQ
jgi:hypothetical protein